MDCPACLKQTDTRNHSPFYGIPPGKFGLNGNDAASAPNEPTAPGDSCDSPGGVHLLTIYPLRNLPDFARLSCVAVSEPVTPCGLPFCASRHRTLALLLRFLPAERVRAVLADLDNHTEVLSHDQ